MRQAPKRAIAAFVSSMCCAARLAQAAAPHAQRVDAQAQSVALSDGVHHADAAVRQHASLLLGQDTSVHGITLLYLLAHDTDADVQQSALASTLTRCSQETPSVCAGMIRFFIGDDEDTETHWQARDWLLLDDPQAATQAATLAYKLDVVARMGERADQPELSVGALRVLRLLAEDPQPEVQEAASTVLLRAKL